MIKKNYICIYNRNDKMSSAMCVNEKMKLKMWIMCGQMWRNLSSDPPKILCSAYVKG